MEISEIDFLAIWGAVIATALAIVKFWELWRDRFNINVGFGMYGSEDRGHDVNIRNLSTKPIILSYWEIFYRYHVWPFKADERLRDPEADACDIAIPPGASKTLNFDGQDHFDCGWRSLKGRRIYIRLHIVGRGTVVRKLYGEIL